MSDQPAQPSTRPQPGELAEQLDEQVAAVVAACDAGYREWGPVQRGQPRGWNVRGLRTPGMWSDADKQLMLLEAERRGLLVGHPAPQLVPPVRRLALLVDEQLPTVWAGGFQIRSITCEVLSTATAAVRDGARLDAAGWSLLVVHQLAQISRIEFDSPRLGRAAGELCAQADQEELYRVLARLAAEWPSGRSVEDAASVALGICRR